MESNESMSPFLTEEEVIELTNSRRCSTQKERLASAGINAIYNGKRVIVDREALIRYMLNEKPGAADRARPAPRLDLEGIRT